MKPLISKCSMIPAWHQLVSISGHVEESETARKLQLYATSIKTSVSTRLKDICNSLQQYLNAVVNRNLELTLLKGRQRFDAFSTSNLEVYKFRDWWIFTCFIFGHDESSPNNIWSMVNLEQTCVLLFYYFLYFKVNLDLEKTNQLGESSRNFNFAGWILTQLFWKRGELMVNPDLTILLKRWTEVKTWSG